MPYIPILIVVAVVILAMYFLLNKKSEEQDREGHVKDILSKDALSVEFDDGRTSVVKLWGIALASETEMLDDKIYGFYDENLRGQRVKVRVRQGDTLDLVNAQVYAGADEYVNAILVRQGFARWAVSEAPGDSELADSQEKAKAEMLGVWNPAVRQLVEDKRRNQSTEGMSDDEISNMTVDPEDEAK